MNVQLHPTVLRPSFIRFVFGHRLTFALALAGDFVWRQALTQQVGHHATGAVRVRTLMVKAPVLPANAGYTGVKTRIRDCTSHGVRGV